MSIIIRPEDSPSFSSVYNIDIPERYMVIFLAGPIKGAPDWQALAIGILDNTYRRANLVIANPRCLKWHGNFNHQVDWETFHLRRADVILFWCAAEVEHDPNRAYAQTTRFELGEHYGRSSCLVLGIEPTFTGEAYIKRRMSDCIIHSDLHSTCKAASDILYSKQKGI